MIHLIDVSGYIYRAFYALPNLTFEGQEVGALYGFCSAMQKVTTMFPNSMFIAALDSGKKTFRNDIYEEYKANRKAMPEELVTQIPLIKEACEKFGFFKVEKAGFEADDIIATYAKKITDHEINIISSDKDLMQLMSDRITIYDPMKRKYITEDDVIKKFGVTHDKVLDVLALMGDTSDNIPGVSGIGPKTASALINEFGSLDNLIANLDKLPKSKKNEVLKNEIDKALLSRELARLRDDLELDYKYEISISHGLNEFFLRFGFESLIKSQGTQKQLFSIPEDIDEENENPMAIFTEDLDDKRLIRLKTKLEDSAIQKICTDAKALYKRCFINNIKLVNTIDLSVMSYCVSGTLTKHDFDSMVVFYGTRCGMLDDFTTSRPKKLKQLYSLIFDKLNQKTKSLFFDIENEITEVLAKMEYRGIKVDIQRLKELEYYFESKIDEIAQKIYKIAGEEFNIGSPQQVAHIIYDKLGFNKLTKKAHTDSDTLMMFSGKKRGIANQILDWRGYSKLLNSYVKSLLKLADKESKIHTTYSQTIVNTGRLSSSEPNLQNIPIRTTEGQKIRSCFIASEGSKLISFDYSQMELRILAHMSDCVRLKESFIAGRDIHKATASHIFNIPDEDVTPEQRRLAKVINFSVIYGMTPQGLSRRFGLSKERTDELYSRFMRFYPEVFKYMDDLEKFAEKNGYVETIFGRKCYTPLITSSQKRMVSFAKRQAINAPIQGSNADIIKKAMVKLSKEKPDLQILLQIHDELIIEAPDKDVDEIVSYVKSTMENITKLSIPLSVGVKIGDHL